MRVLVVDDSATMRRILTNFLTRLGHEEPLAAGNGFEGLERFDDSVDCVIADWKLPAMDGAAFVQTLRARPDGRSVPVLMVTTRCVGEDFLRAIETGADDYIVKPFSLEALRGKLERITGRTVRPGAALSAR